MLDMRLAHDIFALTNKDASIWRITRFRFDDFPNVLPRQFKFIWIISYGAPAAYYFLGHHSPFHGKGWTMPPCSFIADLSLPQRNRPYMSLMRAYYAKRITILIFCAGHASTYWAFHCDSDALLPQITFTRMNLDAHLGWMLMQESSWYALQ